MIEARIARRALLKGGALAAAMTLPLGRLMAQAASELADADDWLEVSAQVPSDLIEKVSTLANKRLRWPRKQSE